ncbi:hypothetical protein [Kaarinaea lacus]
MKHCCNVMLYIQQFVSREQLAEAKNIVDTCKGIVNSMLGQASAKLLLVDYDPDMVSGKDIIDTLKGHGITAKLVGM